MDGAIFIANNLLAAAAAALVAGAAMRGREPWRRAPAAVCGFPVVILGVVLLLGSLGRLSGAMATLVLVPLAGGLAALRWRRRRALDGPPNSRAASRGQGTSVLFCAALALLAAFSAKRVYEGCVSGVDFRTDALSYHASAPAHWLQDGRLSLTTLTPLNYRVYFPLNAEVLSLWFMLPFRADGMVGLCGVYWALLAVVAAVGLGRRLGYGWGRALLPGALLLSSTVVGGVARTFAAVGLAGAALVLAATAFAADSPGKASRRARLFDAAYAGLAAGLAVGCKTPFLSVAALLFLWLLLAPAGAATVRDRLSRAATFALCAALTGSFWYLRNTVLSGNPLFPAEMGPFAGPYTRAAQAAGRPVAWILENPADPHRWLELLEKLTHWRAGLLLISAGGYVTAAWSLWRRHARTEGRSLRLLLLLVGLVLTVLYFVTPTIHDHRNDLRVSLRYLIAPFAIGLVLFPAVIRGGKRRRMAWTLAAVLAALTSWHGPLGALAAAVVAAGLAVLWRRPVRRVLADARRRAAAGWAVLATFLVLLAACAGARQRATDEALFDYGEERFRAGRVWRAVNELPDGSRIAWFHEGGIYYPLFGRRLQLRPRAVAPDGSPYRFLHQRWLESPEGMVWPPPEKPPELTNLVTNLGASGVDYAVVSKLENKKWPPQQAVLAKSPRVRAVYEDGNSVIWEISRPGSAPATKKTTHLSGEPMTRKWSWPLLSWGRRSTRFPGQRETTASGREALAQTRRRGYPIGCD